MRTTMVRTYNVGGTKTRPVAASGVTADGRKMRKAVPATTTQPYDVQQLKSRRRGNRNAATTTTASRWNLAASSGNFVTETTTTLSRNSEGGVDNCSESSEVVVSGNNGCNCGEIPASCCSSTFAWPSSESDDDDYDEVVKECTCTSEIVADPEVNESGETSSRLIGECCNASADILIWGSDGQESSTVRKSTVEIKMPSESEIEDFFTAAENDLHQRFSDKYNFDVVKDVPLEGRYEWVQIKP